MATHNRMAFSRADVPDSKRGYPDFDLRGYAARRGLGFLDHDMPAGFRAALPGYEEHSIRVTAKGELGGILGFVPVVSWFVGSAPTATVRVPCSSSPCCCSRSRSTCSADGDGRL
jgi:hypothetical protein